MKNALGSITVSMPHTITRKVIADKTKGQDARGLRHSAVRKWLSRLRCLGEMDKEIHHNRRRQSIFSEDLSTHVQTSISSDMSFPDGHHNSYWKETQKL